MSQIRSVFFTRNPRTSENILETSTLYEKETNKIYNQQDGVLIAIRVVEFIQVTFYLRYEYFQGRRGLATSHGNWWGSAGPSQKR